MDAFDVAFAVEDLISEMLKELNGDIANVPRMRRNLVDALNEFKDGPSY